MPYLNPAGVAGLPNDVLAVSASVYAYSKSSFNGFFHPQGFAQGYGQVDITDESVSSKNILELPSSVMYVKHLGRTGSVEHVAALSLVIPVAGRFDIQGSYSAHSTGIMGTDAENRAVSQATTDYYLGPSYAVSFGKSLRIGASVYAVYGRSVVTQQLTASTMPLGGAVPLGIRGLHSSQYESLSLVPVLGMQVQPIQRLWAGLGIAAPGTPISGNVRSSNQRSGTTADVATSQPIAFEEGEAFEGNRKVSQPLRINFGLAWEEPDVWAVAADVHWYAPRDGASRTDGLVHLTRSRTGETARVVAQDFSSSFDMIGVFDLSVGGEVWLSRMIAIRAGVLTDRADTPDLGDTTDLGELYRQRLDRYGATLGVGIQAGSFDSTVGAFYMRGAGKIVVPDTTSDQAQTSTALHGVPIDMTTNTFGVILSTAVTTDEAASTIRNTLPTPGGAR